MEKTAAFAGKKFWKCSIALFAALIFTLVFSAVVSADSIPITVKTTKDALNIRTAADTNSEILTVIEKKDTTLYPVGNTSANWYKVRFANDVYGYVFKEYVTPGAAESIKSSVSLFSGAAIRTEASASAPVQKICSVETELTITGQDSSCKWYYVKSFNGESGYMLKSSVKALTLDYPTAYAPVEHIDLLESNATSGKVRAKATTSSDIVATLTRGQLVTVLGEEKGSDGYTWYKIRILGDQQGYVRQDVVKAYDTSHLQGKVIAIDPGHGCLRKAGDTAIDKGNIGISGTLEKDINLAVARNLQTYLAAAEAKVVMTRESDVGLMTLTDRADIGKKANADIFLAIHCNYSTNNKDKTGVLTYYYKTDKNKESGVFAEQIQKWLSVDLNAKDWGVASDSFTVLVNSPMPASLVELGYMSNEAEDKLLKSKDYQMLCAQGLYKGILKYLE